MRQAVNRVFKFWANKSAELVGFEKSIHNSFYIGHTRRRARHVGQQSP